MTDSSARPAYTIADLKALLSQRAGLDLSLIELVEILWLAVQESGGVIPERPLPPSEPALEISEPDSRPDRGQREEPQAGAAVVAEEPKRPEAGDEEARGEEPQAVGTALPVNIPEAVALRNRREIARSLRPLMRKVPSKLRRGIDEEATATQSAEAQTWQPVVKPEPERWLELAIVVEVTNLLDVWQDTIAEFRQLMERHGAFRDVRTWQLKSNEVGEPQLFLQTASGLRRNARSPRELLDAGGRRLVLLLSDCTSTAWRSGKIPKLLKLWSRENPVTIVQLLPEHYWDRSALRSSYRVMLQSRLPGALSRDWLIEGLSPLWQQRLREGLKLPVVTIQPESLGQWAKAIAAIGEQQTIGIVLNLQAAQSQVDSSSAVLPTAKQLVQQFRKTASAEAQELADRMAVLPVNWSVIRLIQKNLAQQANAPCSETGALHLAEIFLSGLLRPVQAPENSNRKASTIQQYDFVEGVRELLIGTIPISEAQEVGETIAEAVFKQLPLEIQQRVAADIERRFGESLSYFEAFLVPDLPWGEDARAEVLPFARVTGQVLRQWGGEYAALAHELEQRKLAGRTQFTEEVVNHAYSTLNTKINYLKWKILDTFILQEHDFQLSHDLREPGDVVEVILTKDEASVKLLDANLIEVSHGETSPQSTGTQEGYRSFELTVKIDFSAKIRYVDPETYRQDPEDILSFEQLVPNQSVQAVAVVNLWVNGTEVEPELVDLRVEEPIQINESQAEPSADIEAQALQFLERSLDYYKELIAQSFLGREHDFRLNLSPDELSAQQIEKIEISEDSEVEVIRVIESSLEIVDVEYKEVLFSLTTEIRFAIEISYFDFESFIPEIHEDGPPTFSRTIPNQVVEVTAQIPAAIPELEDTSYEYNYDFLLNYLTLAIDEPILVSEDTRNRQTQTPPLQEFEFEVATIVFEAPISSEVALEPFEFEMVTIAVTPPSELQRAEVFRIVEQAMRVQTDQRLTALEQEIVEAAWEGRAYRDVAEAEGVSVSQVSAIAAKLFRKLSDQLGIPVSKKAFRAALMERTGASKVPELTFSHHHQQAQQFVEMLADGVRLEMVQIPGGSFVMGLPERNSNESQHRVTLNPFFMGKYPVTQAQWRAVAALPQVERKLGPDPSDFEGDNHPVEQVSWKDAVEFCNRLSQFTGKFYRLPSEAEWEYACRAGTTTPFHFGETITPDLANYNGTRTYGAGLKGIYRQKTTPVGSFGVANAFGLSDMHGNVWEWCADRWHESYRGGPIDGSAWVEGGDENRRVLRGGSWAVNPQDCRSAVRIRINAVTSDNRLGFRVVCSA